MNRYPSRLGSLYAAALVCGLGFAAGANVPLAHADDAPPPPARANAKRPPPDPNKAKPGQRCQVDSDCDRANAQCLPAGDHKQCTLVPPKAPVGPVVPVVT